MMHGMEKSDEAVLPVKRRTRERERLRSYRREGPQPRGIREAKAHAGRSAGQVWHRRWTGYGKR